VLREALSLNPRITPLLVSRVKVMARLDIAEKRVPQDGRIPLALGGKTLDVRVSTLPSRAGERVVMRILDKEQGDLRLDDLGMDPAGLEAFQSALREPNGIILVTGPTGSGKTTSLYAGLTLLNDATRNILTVEDPVEYAVEGIGQTQVNPKVGMTFAAGLRAILRQDPDVVMVGEIRDVETAQIAVQASLTGHLVLSTVHTNDAAGAVTRLRDMGVEPFLLASTLRLIVAQRLVRRLCAHCRREETADAASAKLIGIKSGRTIWRAQGCGHCNHTGHVGRIGLYEMIRVDDRVRRLIAAEADEDAINAVAFDKADTLARRARALVLDGVTSIEEAVRVIRQDAASDPKEAAA
jgi:general secretion pathway protein E